MGAKLYILYCLDRACLVSTGSKEGAVVWVPPASDDLVHVGGHLHTGQRVGQVTLQICQHHGPVITSRQKVK